MDGIGTTKYSYAMLGNGLSTMTEDGPWASDEVTVTNRGGLRGGLKITQPTAQYVVTNQYDGAKRLTTIGGTAGTFNYFYSTALPSGLPLGIALPGGPAITNRYDSLARLTSTELWTNTLLNLHGYQYNNAFQRTWASRTNSAATAWNGYQDLAYDAAGELTKSWAYTNGTAMLSEKWTYGYDPAQNLLKRTNNTTVETFAANALNQLSSTPNSTPTYDRRGNLTARTFSGGVSWGYYYDHENRLTNVIDYYNPTLANRFKVDFTYDGQGRLRTMKPYTWMDGWGWYEGTEKRYLYDGMQIVQERSGNVPSVTYTRGRDLSGSLSGAGGIGGLLARSSGYSSGTGAWSTHDFYHADGNGNITAMVNASGTLRAYYRYDPFGRQRAQGGALATANVMRFSSKPWVAFNANISDGLYYYGYRFYDPYLQRWVNRDPIRERGGINLYGFVLNSPQNGVDAFGLDSPTRGTNDEERSLACRYPKCALAGLKARKAVLEYIDNQPGWKGGDGERRNAVLHCTWMCMMASTEECGPLLTEMFGDAHEANKPDDPRDPVMDKHNNSVGIGVAEYGIGLSECFNRCVEQSKSRNLWWYRLSPGPIADGVNWPPEADVPQ